MSAKPIDPKVKEQHELEARIDAMMDIHGQPEPSAAQADTPAASAPDKTPPEPLNIFADTKTAPELPKELLKSITSSDASATTPPAVAAEPKPAADSAAAPAAEPSEPATAAKTPPLDDATSDAAVDDIVAQESDRVLEAEDDDVSEAQEIAADSAPASPHHHPIFWFMIALIAVVAVVIAAILIDPIVHNPY